MITLAVCENDTVFRKNIAEMCRNYFESKDIAYRIREYASGEEFLVESYPDIVVLAVRMRRLSGLLVKEILGKMQAEARIIFVAENKNHVTEAFGKNVYGYLLKPLKYELFSEKMDEIVMDIKEQERHIFCKNEEGFERVYFRKILYVEAFGRKSKVYVQGGDGYRVSELSIGKWEELLKTQNFARCNKQQIVNFFYVTKVSDAVELGNEIKLPLGLAYRKNFLKEYGKGDCG